MEAGSGFVVNSAIKVYRPQYNDFRDFQSFIASIEKDGAHKLGIAKIVPPPEWIPRPQGYDVNELCNLIERPVSQVVTGSSGIYEQLHFLRAPMTVKEFYDLANSQDYRPPEFVSVDDIERRYWKGITFNPPIYGLDVLGTLFDPSVKEWNLNHLGSILDTMGEYNYKIEGINTSYLYFGMWRSRFAWHTEDMDLYSINYLHTGAPKFWYAIPTEEGNRFERVMESLYPGRTKSCSSFIRHKTFYTKPSVLKNNGITVNSVIQEKGDIIITFPYGYHSGYNLGFNIAEAINFATERWIEYGKRINSCTCRRRVSFSMAPFVLKYQPDKYQMWLEGRDYGEHPEIKGKLIRASPRPVSRPILNDDSDYESFLYADEDYQDLQDKAYAAVQRQKKLKKRTRSEPKPARQLTKKSRKQTNERQEERMEGRQEERRQEE